MLVGLWRQVLTSISYVSLAAGGGGGNYNDNDKNVNNSDLCVLFNEHLQCAGYCAKCLPYAFSLHPQNHPYDSRYIIHPIVQMRTLKLREVKLFA